MYCLVCERESQSPSAYCELCGYALVEDSARASLSCAECADCSGYAAGRGVRRMRRACHVDGSRHQLMIDERASE